MSGELPFGPPPERTVLKPSEDLRFAGLTNRIREDLSRYSHEQFMEAQVDPDAFYMEASLALYANGNPLLEPPF